MRTMGKYIVKRILLMFLTMFIIMTICFILIKMLPLPAVREMGRDVNLILAKREAMGYNKPLLVQYFLLLKNVFLHWDWGVGEQMYEALNVWDVLVQKLPYTVLVNLYSILLAIPLGLVFGIYAALKKNRWQDHVVSTLVVVFITVPSYVYAFIVQYLFCYKLGWFPLTIESLESTAFFSGRMLVSMMPAILSLGFGVIAGLTRYTRAELSEVLTSEFMLLARTKGLTKAQATSR
ncbi:MAG TPA: ABC transporter permease, partial [Clostridia bacterium]|nr:ABC transporter permease [Clostridia bacterium]